MVVSLKPDTVVFSWYAPGTTNSIGNWSAGTLSTVSTCARIVSGSHRPMVDDRGKEIPYRYKVIADVPVSYVPGTQISEITFYNKKLPVLNAVPFETHLEVYA